MFAKLLAIIAVMGAVACALLVNRQQRVETVHRAAAVHRELLEHKTLLWALRGQVADRCQPDRLRPILSEQGDSWAPRVVREEGRAEPLPTRGTWVLAAEPARTGADSS